MQNMDITSSSAKTRIRDVTKAVTALQGQLPVAWGSSVHAAIDEDRPDLFRVLVLPDIETPYAHGAFLFDFMLPKDFPNSPPKVRCSRCRAVECVCKLFLICWDYCVHFSGGQVPCQGTVESPAECAVHDSNARMYSGICVTMHGVLACRRSS